MNSNRIATAELAEFDQVVGRVIEYEGVVGLVFGAVLDHAEHMKNELLAGRATLFGASLSFKLKVIQLNDEAVRILEHKGSS